MTTDPEKMKNVQFLSLSYLCNLLFVVDHEQRNREQNGPEAFHGFLEASRRGQLVALLQA